MESILLLYENTIQINYIYLFRTELLWWWQIFAIIVAQMVVADNGNGFNASTYEEINQNWLQFGLARFEIIASYVNAV